MTNRVIYPGTFDPVTHGHSDIIARAAKMFDHVVVGVAFSPSKKTLFSLEERVDMLTQATAHLSNVSIVGFSGLLVNLAKEQQTNILVRGLRTTMDFEYELGLTTMYKKLMPTLETVFLTPPEEHGFLSSTIVRETAIHGGKIDLFVHPYVAKAIYSKVNHEKQ
ncbi:pantetheine-phosphate adenylyltransferase [Aliivibrio sp. S4TY2]|uniref:pantetheine-phosphate adenylyltransferase n=1 Tax=unclassified Aliivibrio TaxID=2645654 RepID=UPI0023781786|nr:MULTISPECIES: pantetheine-phosphate adenylyltransferase [unclassified Aliivibrio]MDD9156002.1 pantetheine-phosphate adenylyltransferase [Aliivibrio sp. S4TY2]MDD9159711.1 pantetheine-phosphate adenylyltransferase [Aliivibrio sp. S4TY1]MDD9163711.1 pantetheine-phosphate adenylyltransferase [Aliivibrio sp. S4MY2]MDD9167711.1 pantetheine-phosphate adenylyltransferase [Aliivibrio sp. S4MY4]MDD9185625.1 pantetheine-phosphate adenylyltransferase [Aliivibrio sp. S4MY3]